MVLPINVWRTKAVPILMKSSGGNLVLQKPIQAIHIFAKEQTL
jgi:hypothetical protein